MPGKVLKVLVAEGQTVEHGEPLIVLEAMKMETTLYAESAGDRSENLRRGRADGRSWRAS